jgi:MFS family permease
MTSIATPADFATPIRSEAGKGVTLIAAQILPVMAVVSLFPAIPRLFAQFGGHPSAGLLVPMIVTMPSLCVALFAPFAGMIADRFGRRPSFLLALAVYALAGLAPLVLDDLYLVVASRAVLGLAEAVIVTNSSALIGDYFGAGRHRWVSWVGVSISVAGTLLVAAGGALADLSWRGPFAIYALAIPTLLLALLYIDEPARRAAGREAKLGFPWAQALAIGLVTMVASVLYYVEPLHIAGVLVTKGVGSSTEVGLIQAATSLAYIAGAFLYRRIHAQSVGILLGLAGVLTAIGLMLIALASHYPLVALGGAIQQFGSGLVIPALLAWGQAMLPLEQRGRGMGIWATAFFAGLFLCPPLVGAGRQLVGGLDQALLLFAALTLALSILSALFLRTNAARY